MDQPVAPISAIKIEVIRMDGKSLRKGTTQLMGLRPSQVAITQPGTPEQPVGVPVAIRPNLEAAVEDVEGVLEELRAQLENF